MKKYILKTMLIVTCHLFSNNVFCTGVEYPFVDTRARFIKHGHDDSENIKQHLQSFNQAELHLFWTSGRDPEILQKEMLEPQIQIGGSTYADLFPLALKALLLNSPENLAVHLVLDSVTQKSNQTWLESMQNQFSSRFHISDIDTVTNNIVTAFPEYEPTIKTVFANATKGNPAITSDIYRLIGMVYGQNPLLAELHRKQLTYCDVDTFCHGLQDDDHAKFIAALFAPPTQWQDNLLYLSKRDNNNDVIKLQVSDESRSLYDTFCHNILDHLKQNLESKDMTILNYFPKLQNLITDRCIHGNNDNFVKRYLSEFQSSEVDTLDILGVTGPYFLKQKHNFIIIDDFPAIKSYQWIPACYLSLEFKHTPLDWLDIRSDSKFKIMLSEYIHTIFDAIYIQRCYGKDFFASQELIKFLAEESNFPFKHHNFKKCLQKTYKLHNDLNHSGYDDEYKADENYTADEKIFEKTCKSLGFELETPNVINSDVLLIPSLKHYLKTLDIEIDFPTQQDLEYLSPVQQNLEDLEDSSWKE